MNKNKTFKFDSMFPQERGTSTWWRTTLKVLGWIAVATVILLIAGYFGLVWLFNEVWH